NLDTRQDVLSCRLTRDMSGPRDAGTPGGRGRNLDLEVPTWSSIRVRSESWTCLAPLIELRQNFALEVASLHKANPESPVNRVPANLGGESSRCACTAPTTTSRVRRTRVRRAPAIARGSRMRSVLS